MHTNVCKVKNKTVEPRHMAALCYLCLAGPAVQSAPGYGFGVCQMCWHRATQGWDTQFDETIFIALSKAGLLIPDRNDLGRLPRVYAPPADFKL